MELFPLILIAFVCVAVGVIIGVMVTSLIRSKTPVAPAPDPELEHAAGLWRERRTSSLLVEVDSLKFHSIHDMSDDQRQRLAKAVEDLRVWSGSPETPRVGEIKPAPVAKLSEAERFAGQPPAQPDGSIKRPSLNPVDMFTRALRADVPNPGSPPMSIAGQIDEILQAKLEDSPLKGRAIRLMELPGKGMVVMVGLDQYDSVSSVPDPEIRSLLQACVEEWEGRHT